ncbi:MAG: glycosyltransferase [Acidobacteriota bacterium]
MSTMPHIAVVVDDEPITPDAPGGAAALVHTHVTLLLDAGFRVSVLVLRDPDGPRRFETFTREQPERWKTIEQRLTACYVRDLRRKAHRSAPLQSLMRALSDRATLILDPEPTDVERFAATVQALGPDALLAVHLVPASLLHGRAYARLAIGLATRPLTLYDHFDWHWRIKAHRAGRRSWRQRLRHRLTRGWEEHLVKIADGVVTGSASEAATCRRLGARNVVNVPTAFEVPASPPSFTSFPTPPRLVHLGGMSTTANRLGLGRFLDVVWPEFTRPRPELWVIGSLRGADATLLERLENDPDIVTTGFVDDLATVLRPGDLHIVPWEHDTGTRTRVPLALRHGQVLVSTRAAVACLPEIEDGRNAVLVDTLDAMRAELDSLAESTDRRHELAEAGWRTFLDAYTHEALRPRIETFFRTVLDENGAGEA